MVRLFLGTTQEAIDTDDGSAYYRTYETSHAANGLKSDFNGHSNEHYRNVYGYVDSCWEPSGLGCNVSGCPNPNPNPNASPHPHPNPNANPDPSPHPG